MSLAKAGCNAIDVKAGPMISALTILLCLMCTSVITVIQMMINHILRLLDIFFKVSIGPKYGCKIVYFVIFLYIFLATMLKYRKY